MKPVKQLNDKDCLRACIASLLEVPTETVPDWAAMRHDPTSQYPVWWIEMQSWLKFRGWMFLEFQLAERPWMPVMFECFAIFMGLSPKGSIHSIVGRVIDSNFVPMFDPLTGEEGDKAAENFVDGRIAAICFLVPLDPSKMASLDRHSRFGEPVIMN